MTHGYTTNWTDCSAMQPRGSAGLSRLGDDSMSVFAVRGGILVLDWTVASTVAQPANAQPISQKSRMLIAV
jgi:hypothetical protein